jgi:histone deacetylase HOS3
MISLRIVNSLISSVLMLKLNSAFAIACEDGDPTLVQAASINIDGGHSQYIANIHLEPFETEAEFHKKLYERYRNGLLGAAKCFCDKTSSIGGSSAKEGERTLIFISAGRIFLFRDSINSESVD